MTAWPREPLSALGTWFGGGTPSKSRPAYWHDGSVPWLSPKDMGPTVLTGTTDHITDTAVANSSTRLVAPNSVAVVVRSGILERTIPVAVVPFATTLNQDMKALTCRPGIDPRWVAWGLRASERELLRTARKAGTTVASLEWSRFLDWRLPVPPLGVQQRIVGILEDHLAHLDAANDYLDAAHTRARSFEEQTVLRRLLPGAAGPSVANVVDGTLPELPGAWAWKPLGEVAHIVGGVTKDAKKQSDPTYIEVPYLRVANVQRAHLDLRSVATIRVRPTQAEALRLRPGDVLMNEGGDRDKLARGWVWAGQIADCIHQNHVFRARPDTNLVRPKWLAWCANTYGSRWAQRHGRQSVNLASISRRTLSTMPIPVAPLGEQDRSLAEIDAILVSVSAAQESVASARHRSAALRRGLLAAAFSGRLTGRSSDLDLVEEMAEA